MALFRTGLYVKNHSVEKVQVAKTPIASYNGNVTGLYIPELIAYITAKQSGSGTPAPDNIMPISGWSECNVTNNGNTYIIQFGDTYYGGSLDVTNGVLTVTHKKVILDGTQDIQNINWRPQTNSVGWLYSSVLTDAKKPLISQIPSALSDKLRTVSYDSAFSNDIDCFAIVPSGTQNLAIRVKDTSLTTKPLINAYLADNPITIVYELATPITVQLTPTQVEQLLGANNVSADTGDVEVKFYNVIR